jgi:peptidoglycan DL-endopeptidase CwlO
MGGPTAASADLHAQREHARLVAAQVNAINMHLDRTVQAWDGARVRLLSVDGALRTNELELRIARSSLRAAEHALEKRLVELYVSPPPGAVDVLVGAKNISDLIDGIEATHAVSAQDATIANQARRLQTRVGRHEQLLRRERRIRTQTLARLSDQRKTITRGLARERALLATIHQSIDTLEAQQAAHERQIAALARERIARQVASAKEHAARAALAPTPTPLPPIVDETPPPAPPPALSAPPASAPPPPAPVIGSSPAPPTHAEAASIAAQYLGVPYLWGGESPAGFDCSGLVSYVYAQLGVSLPHYTVSQWDATTPISTSDLQPGDLVFFDGLSHVGIYIGGGQFIHAPHTGTVVQIASLSGYWAAHLDGSRRVP